MLRRSKRPEGLGELVEQLPDDLRRQAFTHASWVEHRSESYERLAFLGDVVLSLAVSDHLFPRFERYGAGRLTKVRAQAVSGASVRRVAQRARRARAAARGARRRHRPQRGDAGGVGAGAGVGLRGADRRRLPLLRHRAHGARRWSTAFAEEIDDALEHPGRLQVGAPGAAGAPGGGGGLPDRRRGGPAARPQLRGRGRGRRAGGRPRGGKDEEARRAGGRAAGSRQATPTTDAPALDQP